MADSEVSSYSHAVSEMIKQSACKILDKLYGRLMSKAVQVQLRIVASYSLRKNLQPATIGTVLTHVRRPLACPAIIQCSDSLYLLFTLKICPSGYLSRMALMVTERGGRL